MSAHPPKTPPHPAPAPCRTAENAFKVTIAPEGLLVTTVYCGNITADEMRAHLTDFTGVASRVRPGFVVLTDLSGLESMETNCLPILSEVMDLMNRLGVGRVVRVIPNPRKDIGFNILSMFHYRHGIPINTCETMEEALALLK
jgi:hypothetical protein